MIQKNKYVPKKTSSGNLRTPVSFYKYAPDNGPEPGESELIKTYECFAEVYAASSKDIEILSTGSEKGQLKFINTKNAITIRIRDSFGDFYPSTEDYAELTDYRFKDIRFNIIDVRPDMVEQDFITILLAVIT